jgi:8-hydroxy-5-deazaflavin:NADPH oxidoreductase
MRKDNKLMIIGMLGGTGLEGSGLALRFGQAGFPVLIGSRSVERARGKAQELADKLGKRGYTAVFTGCENAEIAAAADLVFLTAPFEHAADLLKACVPTFRAGTALVDVTVPLRFQAGGVELRELVEGSASEYLAKYLPEGMALVAAFKTIPAQLLADLDASLDCDVFVCSDSQEAKLRVVEIASRIPSLRPLDAGSLREARTLEHMSALAIGINRRYKVKSARFRVVGV